MDELSERTVGADPFEEVAAWYAEARAVHGDDADAMVVASADATGAPSARVVLLRGLDERGFCFFTSYDSRKGRELTENPRGAIVLHWPSLRRQVRATGAVERVSDAESDAYWQRRPVASRFSAWASRQSRPVDSRADLEAAAAAAEDRLAGTDVERPDFWGGFRLVPDTIELWLHRDDRLHDRVQYQRAGRTAPWTITRLQP
ncbi:MAG: pyridoxamine 5'-phosphate oxidase [Actinobacteria bacterium]|nr:pyridoxamine 5'-phosphate oxidase [Actinomycetota bacterium]